MHFADLSLVSAPDNSLVYTVHAWLGPKRTVGGYDTTPRVLDLPFKKGVKRAEKANAIDLYVSGVVLEGGEKTQWESLFEGAVEPLSEKDKEEWATKLSGVSCSSDAFFPFPDNVYRAKKSGVTYLAAPGGSVMDKECIKAADESGMVFIHTDLRLFHH